MVGSNITLEIKTEELFWNKCRVNDNAQVIDRISTQLTSKFYWISHILLAFQAAAS